MCVTNGTATSVSPARRCAGRGQQQRHSLTAASEQHGRPSAQQRGAPELGGGRRRRTAAFGTDWTATSRLCSSGKKKRKKKSFYLFRGEFSGFFFLFLFCFCSQLATGNSVGTKRCEYND